MKNILRIDHKSLQIIMDRTYAKNAENTASPEYQHLQEVRRDYPNYTVIRKTIKKNPNMDRYKGLTYDYMREYIILHSSREEEMPFSRSTFSHFSPKTSLMRRPQ